MKKTLIIVASVLGVLLVVGLFLPTQYNIKRDIEVKASAERLYELVGDLRNWERWSPWKEEDPTIQITYGEQTSGVGAAYSWVGEDGNGRLKITKADPKSGVEYDMFFEDDKYEAIAGMAYQASSDENTYMVSWYMNGEMSLPILGGYWNLMMQPSIAKMFERGLEKFKKEAESVSADKQDIEVTH